MVMNQSTHRDTVVTKLLLGLEELGRINQNKILSTAFIQINCKQSEISCLFMNLLRSFRSAVIVNKSIQSQLLTLQHDSELTKNISFKFG